MNPTYDFRGQVALVTGASFEQPIGRMGRPDEIAAGRRWRRRALTA